MESKILTILGLICCYLSWTAMADSHLHHKYFGGDVLLGEYIPDVSLRARAQQVIGSCYKFSERARAEKDNATFFNLVTPPAPPSEEGIRVFLNIPPALEICAPNFVSTQEMIKIREQFSSEDSTTNAKNPFRAVIVMHPFVRLAKVFLDLENQNEFSEKLKSEIQKFSKTSERIDFQTFVRFLLEGNLGSSQRSGQEETETRKVLRKLLPYHYQCQVCHTAIFPQFVLKLDDHFEEDFENFSEDTGIEDVGIDSQTFRQVPLPSEDKVKSLFQQLTPGQVDELVSKYRVDLDMYQYSPKQYYSYLI